MQPGENYYATIAGIITTLYVAIAVELRLLTPREKLPALPTGRRERVGTVIGLSLVLIALLLGAVGIVACLQALDRGSSKATEVLAQLGVTVVLALFVITTTELLFSLLAQALPFRIRQQRTPILIALGSGLIVAGVVVIALG